jgi:hypothetical protein
MTLFFIENHFYLQSLNGFAFTAARMARTRRCFRLARCRRLRFSGSRMARTGQEALVEVGQAVGRRLVARRIDGRLLLLRLLRLLAVIAGTRLRFVTGCMMLMLVLRLGIVSRVFLIRLVNHAQVVFGMLEIAFSQHTVARGLRVTRQRLVFFGDLEGVAANAHLGPVAVEVLDAGVDAALAAVVAVLMPAAVAATIAVVAAIVIVAAAAAHVSAVLVVSHAVFYFAFSSFMARCGL